MSGGRRVMVKAGDTYSRLTVVGLLSARPGTTDGRAFVRCQCGTEKEVSRVSLTSGNTRSCGCLHREELAQRGRDRVQHGQARPNAISVEYNAWQRAKQRVTNPNRHSWPYYGGRGITMAPEWIDDFGAFFAHIGPKPDPSLSLDRIDNNRGYEPGNVRWADASTQTRNRGPFRPRKKVA